MATARKRELNGTVSDLSTAENLAKTTRSADLIPLRRAALIEAIQRKENLLILGSHPDWQQRNLLHEQTVLLRIGETNWTAPQLARFNLIESVWTWIDSVRSVGSTLSTTVSALLDAQVLTANDSTYVDHISWPDPSGITV